MSLPTSLVSFSSPSSDFLPCSLPRKTKKSLEAFMIYDAVFYRLMFCFVHYISIAEQIRNAGNDSESSNKAGFEK